MLAFALTWVAYASYYLCRKGFGVTKSTLIDELGFSETSLMMVDNCLLGAYAIGQFINGKLGDRIGARRLVGGGMLLSAAMCALFGLSNSALAFMILFGINGFAQSTGWPGTVKAMATWTLPETRGRIMGLWATCYQVGGVAATAAATVLLVHWGWRSAFLMPSLWVAGVGVVILLFLKPGPALDTAVADEGDRGEASAGDDKARRQAQGRLLRDPRIWCYGASYFCLKLIRYSILFWLPYYFNTALHLDKATSGYLSTSFEIGGIAGTLTMGYLSDRLIGKLSRPACTAISMVLLAFALYLYSRFGSGSLLLNFTTMALVGSLLFAADSLISGAAAQDAGGPLAAGLAAGIVNGIGSVGGFLSGVVTLGLKNRYGWSSVFYAFLVLTLVGAVALLPTVRNPKHKAPADGP